MADPAQRIRTLILTARSRLQAPDPMPTYEYACPACGIVEVFQSITEKALTRCPQCKKRKVTRMLSGGAGVIFKGSGFWETDYNRSDDYKAKSKSESDGGSPPKDTSSETKPKTETKTKLADPAAPSTSSGSGGDGKASPPSQQPPPSKNK